MGMSSCYNTSERFQQLTIKNREDTLTEKKDIYFEAQKMLVGSVLAHPEDLDEIIAIVEKDDFSDPALGLIFSSIADLTRANEHVSAFSVASDLESKGFLSSVGGVMELENLRFSGEDWVTQIPPRSCAARVKDGSVKRRAGEILDESKEFLKADSGVSAKSAIEGTQHSLNETLYSISDDTTITKVHEDVDDYLALIDKRKRVYEENKDNNDGLQGIPSNIESLNHYTTGWLPGQLITVAARTSIGKALALDTPLPTPFGWTTMGEVDVGDSVLDALGEPTDVLAMTDVQYGRECFRVEFSDGSHIIADADHLWLTESTDPDTGHAVESVKTTVDILDTLTVPGTGDPVHRIHAPMLEKDFFVINVVEVDSVPVKCIRVANKESLYLAGESMIPTHNSVVAVNSAVAAARSNKSVMFFSLEMSSEEIQDRIYSSISSVPMKELKQGTLTEESEQWLRESIEEFRELKIVLDVDPELTVDNIRAKAIKQAQSDEGLDMIIVDYLQLITPLGQYNSRQEAVRDLSRGMKLLAKQLDVPVMVLAQVNKAKEDAEDDTPRMDQIRESYSIAQDSDIVILLHRNTKATEPDPKTFFILEKNRNGESNKVITCRSDLACSKFEEIRRLNSDGGSEDDEFGSFDTEMSDEEHQSSLDEADEMFESFENDEIPADPFQDDGLSGLNWD